MKKILIFIALVVAITLSLYIFYAKNLNVNYIEGDYNFEVLSKGLKGANFLEIDDLGQIYISDSTFIKKIKKDNSKEIIVESDEPLGDLKIKENKLFYIKGNKLLKRDLENNEEKVIVNNIPNYKTSNMVKLLMDDKNIYLAIDSATNSGVLSYEDKINNPNNLGDLSPIDLILKGINFDDGKTGAFSPYGETVIDNEKRKNNRIGHGAIYKINLNNFDLSLYACGIKSINSIDLDSEGNIYATVSGMEEKGARPLYGDSDYIYNIEDEGWYGWPDYSGGDPVDSPRFRKTGKTKQSFIVKNHPSTPPAPFYQDEHINSLGAMVIDKAALMGAKDSLIIYDKVDKELINLNKAGEKTNILKLNEAEIIDMQIYNKSLYFLDNDNGYLVKVKDDTNINAKFTLICLITVGIILTIILLGFIMKRKRRI